MVKRVFMALALLLLIAPAAARAGDAAPGDADRGAIRQVIQQQLAAFRHDDGAAAFSYASPTIREKFGTAATFMEMVRTGYPPVYRPRDVEFRGLRMVEGRGPVQEVFMIGPDGQGVIALYEMQRQPDGSWKINGCSLAKAPDQGV